MSENATTRLTPMGVMVLALLREGDMHPYEMVRLMRARRDERLLTAVKNLRPEQAECVVLRFLQGLSLAETAKVLGRSEGAVKQLQLRAVRSLHRELADVDL